MLEVTVVTLMSTFMTVFYSKEFSSVALPERTGDTRLKEKPVRVAPSFVKH